MFNIYLLLDLGVCQCLYSELLAPFHYDRNACLLID